MTQKFNMAMVHISWDVRLLMEVDDAVELQRLFMKGIPVTSECQPRRLSEAPTFTCTPINQYMLDQQQIDLLLGIKEPKL